MLRRPPTLAAGGIVAASHPLAVAAAAEMLRRGGHAIDAAVAAGAVLAVVEPSASGLGGDAFFLVDDVGESGVVAVNGSGAAPRDLDRTRFTGSGHTSVPLRSPASCTTPGCVLAWWDAWKRWGRLDWKHVLEPAVALARDGFPISWRMGRVHRLLEPVLRADDGLRGCYLRGDRLLAPGEICRPQAQAATLAVLQKEGGPALYRGPLADALAAGTRSAGGALSTEDLAAHRTRFAEPYRLELGIHGSGTAPRDGTEPERWTVYEQPLPSQGVLLQIMLALVEGPTRDAVERPALELHRQCEAKKIAFAIKDAFLTDPDHLPVAEAELITALLDEELLGRLRRLLEREPLRTELAHEVVAGALADTAPGRRLIQAYREAGYDPARPPASGSGATDTTYLCTADAMGNRVGLIQSIFHPYGSGFLEPETGVLLNNRACGFSLHPGHVNVLEPGKRSLHTLNSYMVHRDGRPWLVGGTPGGDNQVQTNLQVLRHLRLGRDLWAGPPPQVRGKWTQERRARSERPAPPALDLLAVALESPRWRVDSNGGVRIESRMPAAIRKKLGALGHSVVRLGPWDGSGLVQLLVSAEDRGHPGPVWAAVTDPRGEGIALGV